MRYLGSKRKLAKFLLPIVLGNRIPGQLYVEPFCGGMNMIDKVGGFRWANDINVYLISMWKALLDGWQPPKSIDRETYNAMKRNPENYDPHLVGYVGFPLSFGSAWFNGFVEKDQDKVVDGVLNSFRKQLPLLEDMKLTCMSYDEMDIPPFSIIYCDPPYESTKGYKDVFDSAKFWEWCRQRKREGHWIYISEYSAPPDFEVLHEQEVTTGLNRGKKVPRIERLYTPRV